MKVRVPLLSAILVTGIGIGFALGVLARPALQPAGPAPVPAAGAAASTAAAAPAGPTLPPVPEGLSEDELRTIRVFRSASASVVYITSVTYRRDFFTLDVMKVPQGTGSGFLWDRDGHVVTNST